MGFINFLLGSLSLEKTFSKYNGQIEVVRDLTFGTHIKVGGLTQSGGILKEVWKETLNQIKNQDIKNVLILGLGGGSVAILARKFWPQAKITGIDIDEIMVNLGKKYLGLSKIDINIKVEDVEEFLIRRNKKYDLVLIDLYHGSKFPLKFDSEIFVKQVKNKLSKKGIAIFNRLYGGSDRSGSVRFGHKVEKVFGEVKYFYPQANLELICYN